MFSTLFVVLTLVFPRTALILYALMGHLHGVPTPLLTNVVAGITIPRILVAYWLYLLGADPVLIGVYVYLQWVEMNMPRTKAIKPEPEKTEE